ncbi:MAG: hypothetical protein ACI3VZ_03440 [Faecousia sp.]
MGKQKRRIMGLCLLLAAVTLLFSGCVGPAYLKAAETIWESGCYWVSEDPDIVLDTVHLSPGGEPTATIWFNGNEYPCYIRLNMANDVELYQVPEDKWEEFENNTMFSEDRIILVTGRIKKIRDDSFVLDLSRYFVYSGGTINGAQFTDLFEGKYEQLVFTKGEPIP